MTTSPAARAGAAALPQRRHWCWLAAGLVGLFLFALGTRGLNEPDEGRYANIARAMVLSGDWWEPRMSGFGHYDKPPLIYWATALAFKVCGFNEWAARLPSLLGACLALTGLGWTAWRLYDARIAWWAVFICGTSVQFFVLARILTPDMLLTGWCTLAVGAWAEARRKVEWPEDAATPAVHSASRIPHSTFPAVWWSLSLVFWTLAWWTKATPALVPLVGLVLGVWITRDRAGWRALRLPFLLPLVLLLGSVWYLSMLQRYPELREFFFGRELAGRMTGHVHGRRGSAFYYVGISLVAWLPWWPLAVRGAWGARSCWRGATANWRERAAALGVDGWMVLVGLGIFSAASSKLPTYTLPLLPWVALIFARWICAHFVTAETPWPKSVLGAGGLFAIVALAGTFTAGHHETRLGVNSSVREICRLSQADAPRRIYSDRYWPGMEFYLDETRVRSLVEPGRVRERTSDAGQPAGLFLSPRGDDWRTLPADDPLSTSNAEVWLLRFRKQNRSPFSTWEQDAARAGVLRRTGHFALIPARLENGRIVPHAAVFPSPPPP